MIREATRGSGEMEGRKEKQGDMSHTLGSMWPLRLWRSRFSRVLSIGRMSVLCVCVWVCLFFLQLHMACHPFLTRWNKRGQPQLEMETAWVSTWWYSARHVTGCRLFNDSSIRWRAVSSDQILTDCISARQLSNFSSVKKVFFMAPFNIMPKERLPDRWKSHMSSTNGIHWVVASFSLPQIRVYFKPLSAI